MLKKILFMFMLLLLIGGSGFPGKAKADVIFPHASDLAKIMKKNGFTQFDSKRVLYITRYFLNENPLLSTMDAALMALRRIGLASNEVVGDMASFFSDTENVSFRVNNRTTKESSTERRPKMEMQIFTLGDARMTAHVDADNTFHVLKEQKVSNLSAVAERPNERAYFGGSGDMPFYERIISDLGFMLGVSVPF
jgi:hypothetical protein